MSKKSYVVTAEGWVFGTYREIGETVEASELEAKYLLMAGTIAEAVVPAVDLPAEEVSSEKKKVRRDG